MFTNGFSDLIMTTLFPLMNQKLNYLGRAASMLDMGFGDDVECISFINGDKRIVSRFALHVQSSWRIIKQNSIVLAQKDFFEPKDELSYEEFQKESFGNSQFDARSEIFNVSFRKEPLYISQIFANDFGDVTIHFGSNYHLEVFVDVSGNQESWRFFEPGSDLPHFIVFEEYGD